MRIIIACGGTGGHLFPGLAVAQVLKSRGHELLLLVSEKAVDAQSLKDYPEFRYEKLPAIGLPPLLSPAFVRFLHRGWDSFWHCGEIYKKFHPDVLLGMGGFTSLAPLLMGKWKGIPACLHESNAIPGKANRWAARFATRILLGFKAAQPFFSHSECTVVGTPIRQDLVYLEDRAAILGQLGLNPDFQTVLVMGGSQGASGINQLLFKIVPLLSEKKIQVIHLTGIRDDRLAAANYLRENVLAYVSPFHSRMQEVYSVADLVVARSGAASLSEISYFGCPALLIPYPYATENHQYLNAQVYVQAGAAELFPEIPAHPEMLAERILDLLASPQRLQKMSQATQALNCSQSSLKIATILESMVSLRSI